MIDKYTTITPAKIQPVLDTYTTITAAKTQPVLDSYTTITGAKQGINGEDEEKPRYRRNPFKHPCPICRK